MRRSLFLASAILILNIVGFSAASASHLFCDANSGSTNGPYCQYSGTVDRLYFNDAGLLLMYFEHSENMSAAQNVGLTCANNDNSTSFDIFYGGDSKNLAVGEFFYSTLLTAKTSNAPVTILMRCKQGGNRLSIDRIWLN